MIKYVFYDSDVNGIEEYDIRGEDYKKLVQTCCKYSKTFSVAVLNESNSSELIKKLEPYKKDMQIDNGKIYQEMRTVKIYYYEVCPALCRVLEQAVGGIFEWIDGWGFHNLDDPHFFREDESVLFASSIHNGICVLAPKENENFCDVINTPLWYKKEMAPDQWNVYDRSDEIGMMLAAAHCSLSRPKQNKHR